MKFHTLLAASAIALAAGSVQAADLNVSMPMTEPGFDWTGFYAGIGFSGESHVGPFPDVEGAVQFVLGANYQVESVVFGLEGWAGGYLQDNGISGFKGGVDGRIGYLASPDVLIYGSGSGEFYDAGAVYAGVGAGIEFAATENVTFDVNYTYFGWSNNAYVGHRATTQVLYHF